MTGNADTPQGAAAFASAADSLDTLAEAIAGLRSTLNTDAHLDSMLQRLAETAVKALPDADAVSVTVLSADGPRTAASTADYLSAIDDAQHSADRGPCVDAARTMSSVRSKVGDHDDKWPEFTAEARKQGVRSYLSVPLTMGEGSTELLGAFNVYGFASTEFKPFDEELMKLFTAGAGRGDRRFTTLASGTRAHRTVALRHGISCRDRTSQGRADRHPRHRRRRSIQPARSAIAAHQRETARGGPDARRFGAPPPVLKILRCKTPFCTRKHSRKTPSCTPPAHLSNVSRDVSPKQFSTCTAAGGRAAAPVRNVVIC